MTIETISRETYELEREVCNRANAYAERIMCEGGDKRKRNYLTAEETKHPDYAACDNDMRGRVEQYEILRDLPEMIFAYIGEGKKNGMGCDRLRGQSYPVTVWTGHPIGNATLGSKWRIDSYMSSHMYQWYARIGGREYTGRGPGVGMYVRLRETAESKRKRGAK